MSTLPNVIFFSRLLGTWCVDHPCSHMEMPTAVDDDHGVGVARLVPESAGMRRALPQTCCQCLSALCERSRPVPAAPEPISDHHHILGGASPPRFRPHISQINRHLIIINFGTNETHKLNVKIAQDVLKRQDQQYVSST